MKKNVLISTAIIYSGVLLCGISDLKAQDDSEKRNKMQYFRHYDQRGVNVFETPVKDDTPFTGTNVRVGGHFAQQFQSILLVPPLLLLGDSIELTPPFQQFFDFALQ